MVWVAKTDRENTISPIYSIFLLFSNINRKSDLKNTNKDCYHSNNETCKYLQLGLGTGGHNLAEVYILVIK